MRRTVGDMAIAPDTVTLAESAVLLGVSGGEVDFVLDEGLPFAVLGYTRFADQRRFAYPLLSAGFG